MGLQAGLADALLGRGRPGLGGEELLALRQVAAVAGLVREPPALLVRPCFGGSQAGGHDDALVPLLVGPLALVAEALLGVPGLVAPLRGAAVLAVVLELHWPCIDDGWSCRRKEVRMLVRK